MTAGFSFVAWDVLGRSHHVLPHFEDLITAHRGIGFSSLSLSAVPSPRGIGLLARFHKSTCSWVKQARVEGTLTCKPRTTSWAQPVPLQYLQSELDPANPHVSVPG